MYIFLFGIRLQVLYSNFEQIFLNKAGWWMLENKLMKKAFMGRVTPERETREMLTLYPY